MVNAVTSTVPDNSTTTTTFEMKRFSTARYGLSDRQSISRNNTAEKALKRDNNQFSARKESITPRDQSNRPSISRE
jgi:hypothetical protein